MQSWRCPRGTATRLLLALAARGGDKGEGRAVSSAVERLLYTQDVGGSNPSPPTGLNYARRPPVEARRAKTGLRRCLVKRQGCGRRPLKRIRRRLRGPPTDAKERSCACRYTDSLSSFAARKATFLLALI